MRNGDQPTVGVPQAQTVARPRKRSERSGPTIHDVARECSVSAMTVSNVINGRHGEVSPNTRERIVNVMRQLNYHPSAAARALSRKRTETIGIVLGIVGSENVTVNPYMAGILHGVLKAAKHHGYDVNIITRDWINAELSVTAYKDERVDGLLVIAPSQESDLVAGLKSLERPLVTVSGDADQYEIASVDMDDCVVGNIITSHLAAYGHRNIAHITGNVDLVSTSRRLEGYRNGLDAFSIPYVPEYVVHAAYNGEGVAGAAMRLMSLATPPTAVFCGNDTIAFATITALSRLGLDVPAQVSVAGVDDVDAAALVTPPLTTIRQPLAEIGFMATCLLVEAIAGNTVPAQNHLIAPSFIERKSTAPAPARLKET